MGEGQEPARRGVPRGALAAGVAVASTIAVAVLVSWQNPRGAIALSELSFEEQQLSGGGKFRGARLREGAGRGWLPGGVQNAPDWVKADYGLKRSTAPPMPPAPRWVRLDRGGPEEGKLPGSRGYRNPHGDGGNGDAGERLAAAGVRGGGGGQREEGKRREGGREEGDGDAGERLAGGGRNGGSVEEEGGGVTRGRREGGGDDQAEVWRVEKENVALRRALSLVLAREKGHSAAPRAVEMSQGGGSGGGEQGGQGGDGEGDGVSAMFPSSGLGSSIIISSSSGGDSSAAVGGQELRGIDREARGWTTDVYDAKNGQGEEGGLAGRGKEGARARVSAKHARLRDTFGEVGSMLYEMPATEPKKYADLDRALTKVLDHKIVNVDLDAAPRDWEDPPKQRAVAKPSRLSVDLSSVLHMEHKMASAEHRLSEGKFVGPKARWSNLATKEKSQTLTQAKEGGEEHAAAGAQTDEKTHRQAEGVAAFQKAASAKAELGGSESGGSKLARMNVVGEGSSQLVMPDLEKTLYPEKVRQNPKRFEIKGEWKGYHLPPQDDVDGLNKKDEGLEMEKPPCGDECRAEKLAFEKKKAELIAQQPWTGSGMLTAAEQEKAIDRMGQGEKLVVGIINGLDEDSEDNGIKHVADIHTISRMGKAFPQNLIGVSKKWSKCALPGKSLSLEEKRECAAHFVWLLLRRSDNQGACVGDNPCSPRPLATNPGLDSCLNPLLNEEETHDCLLKQTQFVNQ